MAPEGLTAGSGRLQALEAGQREEQERGRPSGGPRAAAASPSWPPLNPYEATEASARSA